MLYIDRVVKSESKRTHRTAAVWAAELLLQVEALVRVRGTESLATELPPVFGGFAVRVSA